jgi:hypothetical protein
MGIGAARAGVRGRDPGGPATGGRLVWSTRWCVRWPVGEARWASDCRSISSAGGPGEKSSRALHVCRSALL